jgi:predicted metal-dependent hydrolase
MTPERSSIQWGRTSIPYTIRRSDRRGTVAVAVEPGGHVVITAPRETPLPRLERVVRQKARWIVTRVQRFRALPASPVREFVSGETFAYLGRGYRLRIIETTASSVRLDHGRLVVRGPREEAQQALVEWYREHAAPRFEERIALWSRKLGMTPPPFKLAQQRLRWGSCTPSGTLLLNWRIIQAPMALVDYVIAHELVHLKHRAHSPAFWAALGRVMPDYERRQRALRERGPALIW